MFSVQAFNAERDIVVPNAEKILQELGQQPIKEIKAVDLISLTDSLTLWVPGGDHSWRHIDCLVEARYFAAELTRFRRASGETECTHGMGAADIAVNFAPSKRGRAYTALINYNHDRKENNVGLITNQAIVLAAWPEAKKRLKMAAISMLNLFTDSPGLHGVARFKEQTNRANIEPTGDLGRWRIGEKLAALWRDLYNLETLGRVPFNNPKKFLAEYIPDRLDCISAIKVDGADLLKTMYIETAEIIVKGVLKRIEDPFACKELPEVTTRDLAMMRDLPEIRRVAAARISPEHKTIKALLS